MNIVRRGFFAHQNHGPDLAQLHRFVGVEHRAAHRRARRGIDPGGEQRQLLEGRHIEHRVQKLIELLRLHAQHGLLLVDQAFLRPYPPRRAPPPGPVRFPLRVCSMYSLLSSMVNSKSCMSR